MTVQCECDLSESDLHCLSVTVSQLSVAVTVSQLSVAVTVSDSDCLFPIEFDVELQHLSQLPCFTKLNIDYAGEPAPL